MSYTQLTLSVDSRGIATLQLNRPRQHNALSHQLIQELTDATDFIKHDTAIRAVILTGAGESFCAGGDLRWMESMASADRATRIQQSRDLAGMLSGLDTLPKPLIGKINGPAYGGGVGMVSVCDIAIAASHAQFALTEVRLGLAPANIAPFVVKKMGLTAARRCGLHGIRFSAEQALRYQLVDHISPQEALDTAVAAEITQILACSPEAIAATKALFRYVDSHSQTDNQHYTSQLLADLWETDTAQEGINCFFSGERPRWRHS